MTNVTRAQAAPTATPSPTKTCAPRPMQMQFGSLEGCTLQLSSETPPRDVLEQASNYLASAKDLLYGIASCAPDDALWGVFHLLEIGKSMLDAATPFATQGQGAEA